MLNLYTFYWNAQKSGYYCWWIYGMIWCNDLAQLIQPTEHKKQKKKWNSSQTSGVSSEKLRSHFHFQGYEIARLNLIKKQSYNSESDVIFFCVFLNKNDTNHFLNDFFTFVKKYVSSLTIVAAVVILVINGTFASKCARPEISTATLHVCAIADRWQLLCRGFNFLLSLFCCYYTQWVLAFALSIVCILLFFLPVLPIAIIIILFGKLIHKIVAFVDISICLPTLDLCNAFLWYIQYQTLCIPPPNSHQKNLPNNRLKTMKITSAPTRALSIEPSHQTKGKKRNKRPRKKYDSVWKGAKFNGHFQVWALECGPYSFKSKSCEI